MDKLDELHENYRKSTAEQFAKLIAERDMWRNKYYNLKNKVRDVGTNSRDLNAIANAFIANARDLSTIARNSNANVCDLFGGLSPNPLQNELSSSECQNLDQSPGDIRGDGGSGDEDGNNQQNYYNHDNDGNYTSGQSNKKKHHNVDTSSFPFPAVDQIGVTLKSIRGRHYDIREVDRRLVCKCLTL